MKRTSPAKKRKFKKAFVDEKKEFGKTRSSIEQREKRLWKLFKPMKELGKKHLKKRRSRHH